MYPGHDTNEFFESTDKKGGGAFHNDNAHHTVRLPHRQDHSVALPVTVLSITETNKLKNAPASSWLSEGKRGEESINLG